MAFKFVVLAAFVAVASASVGYSNLGYSSGIAHGYAAPYAAPYAAAPVVARYAPAPVAYAAPVARVEPYDHNPQYSYAYDVQDALTGDSKSQIESRSGDVVKGQYSLNDPDGTRRTVDYTADPINGFNAVVSKTPLVQKVAVAPVAYAAAPVAYAAPVAKTVVHSAPVAYAAPVAKYAVAPALAYAAPVAKYASAPVAYSGYNTGYSTGYATGLNYAAPVGKIGYSTGHYY